MKRLLGLAVLLTGAAGAQQPADPNDPEDTPGKGVARVSLISGDVSIKRGDTAEWVAAAVNGPLLANDRVLAGSGSRAEVQFDWANLVRLSQDTEVRLSEIEQDRYQIQLAHGTITFAVLRDSSADVDISTPSVSIRPYKKGLYRITVRDGDGGPVTEIAVRAGEADIYSPKGTQRLRAGHTMLVRGTVGDPEFQNVADLPDDDWDRWNDRRNKEMLRSTSYNYVDRGVYGAEDLDGYGTWANVAPYGWVWQPRVVADWAPYRYGRWGWMDYYGWSWISYDPWGWAPYHYGRWFYAGNRWCWWPGAIGGRSFWRPGLVAWVGWGGGGIGIGIGGGWGHVGWVPLAPYERFRPWYGRGFYGRNVIHNTTIVNNVNITNIYRNARVNNGLTVVEGNRFGRGSVNNVRFDQSRLASASIARGALPMVPDRASTHMTDRALRGIPRESGREQFYSRREIPRSNQVPFDDQRRNMEQVARNTFGDSARQNAPMTRTPDGAAGQAPRQIGRTGDGWRRIGEPASQGQQQHEQPGTRSSIMAPDRPGRAESGWQRFGEPRQNNNGISTPDGGTRAGNGRNAATPEDRSAWRQLGQRNPDNAGTPSRDRGFIGREGSPRDMGSRETPRSSRSDGWTGFGSVPDAGSGRTEYRQQRSSGGSMGSIDVQQPMVRDRGSFGGGGSIGRGSTGGGSERMERMSPRMDIPRGNMGGGFGGGMSAPRSMPSAPRMQSAPSPRMSAPPSGGGGGGGTRGGGGGGPQGGGAAGRAGGGRRN